MLEVGVSVDPLLGGVDGIRLGSILVQIVCGAHFPCVDFLGGVHGIRLGSASIPRGKEVYLFPFSMENAISCSLLKENSSFPLLEVDVSIRASLFLCFN